MISSDVTITSERMCDDCKRTFPPRTRMIAYDYADLPGTEWICWDCQPAHEEADRQNGYRRASREKADR